jgi:hypothetical protein
MRFSRTEKKYYALIPQIATIGDAVMMVKGSSAPLVFRKKSTDWKLIGHAYVPGLMKGEQWDEGKCEKIRVVLITAYLKVMASRPPSRPNLTLHSKFKHRSSNISTWHFPGIPRSPWYFGSLAAS